MKLYNHTNHQVAAHNIWETSWPAYKALPLLPDLTQLSAGTTLHRISLSQLLEQEVGSQLLKCNPFLCLILFTAYHHSRRYWLLYLLLYNSSRVNSFSIVIGVDCTQLNFLLCFLVRVFYTQVIIFLLNSFMSLYICITWSPHVIPHRADQIPLTIYRSLLEFIIYSYPCLNPTNMTEIT